MASIYETQKSETVQALGEYSGDVNVFTTLEADGVDEFHFRTDVLDMGGDPVVMEEVALRNARAVTHDDDLRITYNLRNSSDQDYTNVEMRFYASDDSEWSTDDRQLDYERAYTLEAGESDPEVETIATAADLSNERIVVARLGLGHQLRLIPRSFSTPLSTRTSLTYLRLCHQI